MISRAFIKNYDYPVTAGLNQSVARPKISFMLCGKYELDNAFTIGRLLSDQRKAHG